MFEHPWASVAVKVLLHHSNHHHTAAFNVAEPNEAFNGEHLRVDPMHQCVAAVLAVRSEAITAVCVGACETEAIVVIAITVAFA